MRWLPGGTKALRGMRAGRALPHLRWRRTVNGLRRSRRRERAVLPRGRRLWRPRSVSRGAHRSGWTLWPGRVVGADGVLRGTVSLRGRRGRAHRRMSRPVLSWRRLLRRNLLSGGAWHRCRRRVCRVLASWRRGLLRDVLRPGGCRRPFGHVDLRVCSRRWRRGGRSASCRVRDLRCFTANARNPVDEIAADCGRCRIRCGTERLGQC